MRNLFKLLLLLTAAATPAIAARPTAVTVDWNDAGKLIAYATKDYVGTQTIYVTFENLENSTYAKGTPEVVKESSIFITLAASYANMPIKFDKYEYRVINGIVDPKMEKSTIYRIPVGVGKRVEALDVENKLDPTKQHQEMMDQLNFTAYGFPAHKGDTIYAARDGMVIYTEMAKSSGKDAELEGRLSFVTKHPIVGIEHSDGTQGTYSPIAEDGILVNVGDIVKCGDPIGIVGDYPGEECQVRFWVSRYITNPEYNAKKDDGSIQMVIKEYLTPTFATTEGNVVLNYDSEYEACMNDRLIIQDMPKRDLSKWTKERGLSKKEINALMED